MKVWLQDCSTQLFVKNEAMEWTPNREEALSFPSSINALDFYMAHPTKTTQLVLHFADSRMDLAIPVEDCKPERR